MKRLFLFVILFLIVTLIVASCTPGNNPGESTAPSSDPAGGTSEPPATEPEGDREVTVDGCTYLISGSEASLVSYKGNAKTLSIPSSVEGAKTVSLSGMAFAYDKTLESVTIPGTVKELPDLLFLNCSSLRSVVLEEGIEVIGLGCFNNCPSLESVTLPNTLKEIGEVAFLGCTSLRLNTVPSSVTAIGYKAFSQSGIESFSVPAGCLEMGGGLFTDCPNLVSVEILPEIKTLPDMFFAQCYALKNVTLPDSIETVGKEAFYRCTSLEELRLPLHLVSITTSYSFYGCTSLKTLRIPGTALVDVGVESFHFLPSLTDIYYAGTEAQWSAIRIERLNEGLTNATVHFES